MRKKLPFLLAMGFLLACSSNPLLALNENKLVDFINANDKRKLASVCSAYYIKATRAKVTRVSAICSDWTRSLQLTATTVKLCGGATLKAEHFRDKAVWAIWDKFRKAELSASESSAPVAN